MFKTCFLIVLNSLYCIPINTFKRNIISFVLNKYLLNGLVQCRDGQHTARGPDSARQRQVSCPRRDF